jgi:Flp pilus assembly protein TadG
MRGWSAFVADQRGAAAAEMALMIPLLLVLMFTCFEGAHYLYIEHQVVKGVRDGARFAGRQNFSEFSCSSSSISDSTLETSIKDVAIYGKVAVTGSDAPRVSTWTTADTSVIVSCPATAITTGIYKNMTNAPQVTVSATVPYPSLFNALSGLDTSFHVFAQDQAAVMGI